MKVISGILSAMLGILSFYLFIQSKTTLDLSFAFIVMLMAIIFLLFSIMEEQKQDIENLRRQLWGKNNTYTIKGEDGSMYVGMK